MSEGLEELVRVSRETGLPLTPLQQTLFLRYEELIRKWNPYAHLVSARDLERLEWHFADALLLLPLIPPEARELVDIGSGGGLPGIPLKILQPALRFHLIERSRKKAAFLREVVRALQLQGVTVHPRSFEEVQLQADVGVAKALGQWERLQKHLPHLLKDGGLFLRIAGKSENGSALLIPHPLRKHPLRVLCYRVSRETIVPTPCPRL